MSKNMIKPEASMVLLKKDKILTRDDLLYFLQKHKNAYPDINPPIVMAIEEFDDLGVKYDITKEDDGFLHTIEVDEDENIVLTENDEFVVAFTNISTEPITEQYPFLEDGDEKNIRIHLSTCLETSIRSNNWYGVYKDKELQYDENNRCLLNHCETEPTKID